MSDLQANYISDAHTPSMTMKTDNDENQETQERPSVIARASTVRKIFFIIILS